MDFTAMGAREYRSLNADQYEERRSLVLSLAEELPEDATEEQIRSIDEELGFIKAEDSRRDAMTELRNHKAAEVIGGAGEVVGTTEQKEIRVKKDMSLGGRVWEEMQERGIKRDERFQISDVAFRAYNDVQTVGELDGEASPNYYDYALTQVDLEIKEGYRRPMTIWDLFNHETTDKDSVTWFVEGALDGDAAMTAENGAFSQLHVNDPVAVTAPLKKVTALWKQTDEILSDAPRFVSHVNARAGYRLDCVVEDQLLAGNGSSPNLTGLVNVSGIGSASAEAFNMAFIESLLDERTKIRKATPNFNVDTLLLADEDYDALMKLKNNADQYVLGGPTGFVYGQGVSIGKNLWNTITMVPTPALTSGTAILGAFKAGATVYEHVTGRRFDVGYDGEDFSHGRVSFRAYQRLCLAVEYPAAFTKYTVGGGLSA
jgi:HK97 family phage major capsid protein